MSQLEKWLTVKKWNTVKKCVSVTKMGKIERCVTIKTKWVTFKNMSHS